MATLAAGDRPLINDRKTSWQQPRGWRSWAGLALAFAVVFSAAAIGTTTVPNSSEYYYSLDRPSWAPPSWLFGPVWTVLYSAMAVSVWWVWRTVGSIRRAPVAFGLFAVQLVLNAAWTPVFFGLRAPGAALAIIAAMFVAIALTIAAFYRVRRGAAWLLVPYLAWVGFATALNFALWRLN